MIKTYYAFSPRWRFKPAKPVRHQQTCPSCGRKLVNTYLRDGVWKCRRCWEEGDAMTSNQIDAFLAFLRDCEQRYHMAEADELEANAVTNDIHHSLELEEHGEPELLLLALELAGARRKRREAKDVMAQTLLVLVRMEDNRAVVKSLEQPLGEVRKAERIAESRIYTPRTRRPAAREETRHGE